MTEATTQLPGQALTGNIAKGAIRIGIPIVLITMILFFAALPHMSLSDAERLRTWVQFRDAQCSATGQTSVFDQGFGMGPLVPATIWLCQGGRSYTERKPLAGKRVAPEGWRVGQ